MSMPQFEPMSVSGILDRALRLYRDQFVRFVAIAAIVQVPLGLMMSVGLALIIGAGTVADRSEDPPVFLMAAGAVGFLVFMVFALVGHQICTAALLKCVGETYLGGEATVWQAYRFVLRKALTLICAAILVVLISMLGYMLCIVPGVIFSLWYALTTPAIVMENLGAVAGMGRSKQLAKGNLGKIFLVFLIILLITWMLTYPLNFAAGLLAGLISRGDPLISMFITQVAQFVPQIIVMPFSAAASVLLYYDLRIRKEGFDLEMLAASMGSERKAPDVPQPHV